MYAIIRYTLLTATRDLLFLGLFILAVSAVALSSFLGETALVEQTQMTVSYIAGSTRLILVGGLMVFVCFHVRRAFEHREIEVILSRPISRSAFVIAYWLGFVVLAVLAILPVLATVAFFSDVNQQGLLVWGVSLLLEMMLMVGFSLVAALIMRSAISSVMASFAFYLLARMMGFFVVAIHIPEQFDPKLLLTFNSVEYILKAVSVVLPRLDLYAKSSWLLYGINGTEPLWVLATQSLVYIPLLLAIAIYDFKRKQF